MSQLPLFPGLPGPTLPERSPVMVRADILARIKAEGRRPVVASMGGGLDSWAMLLAAAARGELPDVCVFIDVGNCDDRNVPGEWPGTYRYVDEVMKPYAESLGIQWVTLTHHDYPVRAGGGGMGEAPSLFEWMWNRKQIPVSGKDRICTTVAKVERFQAWLDDNFSGETCEVWIGFGADETKRANRGDPYSKPQKPEPGCAHRINRYPLIEWEICRCRSTEIVKAAGFPVPHGSACVFCPYGQMTDWQTFQKDLPELFDRVCELEERKPPTEDNGHNLTIKGWSNRPASPGRTKPPANPHAKLWTNKKGQLRVVTEVPTREWVKGTPRPPKPEPCSICGAAETVRKTVGCGWASDDEAEKAA